MLYAGLTVSLQALGFLRASTSLCLQQIMPFSLAVLQLRGLWQCGTDELRLGLSDVSFPQDLGRV